VTKRAAKAIPVTNTNAGFKALTRNAKGNKKNTKNKTAEDVGRGTEPSPKHYGRPEETHRYKKPVKASDP